MLSKFNLGPFAVVALGGFGLYSLTGDAVAQARDPLHPKDDHDTFELVAPTTSSSGTTLLYQNTVTGEVVEVPMMVEVTKFGMVPMDEPER
jgi:hypothetical protein